MDYVIIGNETYEVKGVRLQLNDKGINDITEIKGLEKLDYLKGLDLSNNNITEIKNLNHLKDLVELNLSNNRINEIKNLENLEKLRFLRLSGNQIDKIKGLKSFKNLMTLYLDGNQIEEIEGLDNLLKLNALYLANNNITEVKGIEHLKRLKRFDIGTVSGVPKEQLKMVEKSGINIKDQQYFAKRRLRKIILYFIGVIVFDLFVSGMITIILQNTGNPADFWYITLWLFIPSMIIAPIVYLIARSQYKI